MEAYFKFVPKIKWFYLEINHTTGSALILQKMFTLERNNSATRQKIYASLISMLVVGIENYQKKFGSAVRPSDDK
jgi:hypothetical protein